jgi:lysine 2,3-aminomutase
MKDFLPYQINRLISGGHGKGFSVAQNAQADNAVLTFKNRGTGDGPEMAGMLKRFHPLFVNIQFNHPDEITPTAAQACGLLADAGIPLGCQSVLLKGVNDDSATMLHLVRSLLSIRVKPHYLHHPDPVAGTEHFRVPLRVGLDIMRTLRGHISGTGVPQYMLDLPGGGGKIPLLPAYIQEETEDLLIVKNFEGKLYEYPLN